ncbi:MAG: hypothetical protein J5J06_10990 [Phycisphaerae bacterium]|nr:hypothetical protein [Phycisphaerae bacterium]
METAFQLIFGAVTNCCGILLLVSSVVSGQEVDGGLALDSRGVPVGCDLIEGDIIFCNEIANRAAYAANLWPGGIVPYEFDANVNSENRQRTIDAVAEWSAVAAISFEPYDPAIHGFNHIHVRDSSNDAEPSNSSFVGMNGGEQIINITSWGSKFIIAHEFGHALGYWHEQSRADRDTYVQIEWDRIIAGKENNFDKHPLAGTYGPYDFKSIMHYGQCSFSCCGADPEVRCTTTGCSSDLDNCRTITVLPPNAYLQDDIGNRSYMSFWDGKVMSFLYPEGDWYFVGSSSYMLGAGTFEDPWAYLHLAYSAWAPEGSTIWILEPGDWVIGTSLLDRPMTIGAGEGIVTLVP